jgi:hypothetical protein
MKHPITILLLVGLAALNTACADETGAAKETSAIAANTGTTATKETSSVALSTSTAVKEPGTTRTAVDLMATPYSDAKKTGQLPANTSVMILERRGGWLKISGNNTTGWVRLHQVRSGEGPEAKGSGEGLAMLKNVGKTGRSGSSGIVATTGIRGLSAAELKSAKPNPKAVEALARYRANDATAKDYARQAGLKDTDVPYLNKP